jgi:hypothetical protein
MKRDPRPTAVPADPAVVAGAPVEAVEDAPAVAAVDATIIRATHASLANHAGSSTDD